MTIGLFICTPVVQPRAPIPKCLALHLRLPPRPTKIADISGQKPSGIERFIETACPAVFSDVFVSFCTYHWNSHPLFSWETWCNLFLNVSFQNALWHLYTLFPDLLSVCLSVLKVLLSLKARVRDVLYARWVYRIVWTLLILKLWMLSAAWFIFVLTPSDSLKIFNLNEFECQLLQFPRGSWIMSVTTSYSSKPLATKLQSPKLKVGNPLVNRTRQVSQMPTSAAS